MDLNDNKLFFLHLKITYETSELSPAHSCMCACKKHFETCVWAALFGLCDVRLHICTFSHTFSHLCRLFALFLRLFKVVSLFIHSYIFAFKNIYMVYIVNKKPLKDMKKILHPKSKGASAVRLNFGKFTQVHATCVRLRNEVCGCACVRHENPSQLTVWIKV